jgi:hypothetical protein
MQTESVYSFVHCIKIPIKGPKVYKLLEIASKKLYDEEVSTGMDQVKR